MSVWKFIKNKKKSNYWLRVTTIDIIYKLQSFPGRRVSFSNTEQSSESLVPVEPVS